MSVEYRIIVGRDMSFQIQAGYLFSTDKIADWLESTGPGGGLALDLCLEGSPDGTDL